MSKEDRSWLTEVIKDARALLASLPASLKESIDSDARFRKSRVEKRFKGDTSALGIQDMVRRGEITAREGAKLLVLRRRPKSRYTYTEYRRDPAKAFEDARAIGLVTVLRQSGVGPLLIIDRRKPKHVGVETEVEAVALILAFMLTYGGGDE